jgi:NAD(P)-dependent dehydrogenase (short-subunit alcohol dehydrogenase family)
MPTPQQPIGSGFGFDSTATDALAGIDLSGRLAIVTGGYSGIGVEMTRALAALGQDAGVRAFSAHPGGILTPLQRHIARDEMVERGWITEDGTPAMRFKTPEQGAATAIWAAPSPRLVGMGGVYCEDCDIAELADPSSPEAELRGVDWHAADPEQAARLWTVSAELTGVDAFATA